jgi:hypothetical protein
MHVSRIAIDLEGWYAQDDERRAALMFSPATTAHEAAALTEDAPSDVDRLPALAARHATVGHAQAAGRARLYGRARINRRDFPAFDDGAPGTHFVSLQQTLEDFNATRATMNAADARTHNPEIGLSATTASTPSSTSAAAPPSPSPRAGTARTRTSPSTSTAPGCGTRSAPEVPSRLLVADLRSGQHPSKPAFRGRDVHERRCLGELAVVRRKRLMDRAMFANRLL